MAERTTIYLDDAINLLEELETKRLQGDVGLLYAPMIKGLKALPSAQPEIIRCKDCKHSEQWYRDRRRCFLWSDNGVSVFDDGFCNYAERRTDE